MSILLCRELFFIINNKQVIIFGPKSSNGHVVYSKQNNKSVTLKMEDIGDQLE